MLSSYIDDILSVTYTNKNDISVKIYYSEDINLQVKNIERFNIHQISKETFERIQFFLDTQFKNTKEEKYTVLISSDGVIQKEEHGTIKYTFQIPIASYPIYDYQMEIRIVENKPELDQEFTSFSSFFVSKKTYFLYDNTLAIHLLHKQTPEKKEENKNIYSIELEIIDKNIISNQELNQANELILKLIQETEYIYTVKEKTDLINYLNHLLGGEKLTELDPSIIVDIRDLKIDDLTWGGIVGNRDTEYVMSRASSSIRKQLVFAPNGIWLVSASFNKFNRLYQRPDENLTGTVYDGELVPNEIKLNTAPKSKYWYLVFDCLSRDGSVAVQSLPHASRMHHTIPLTDSMKYKNNYLFVNTKSFKAFYTPIDFFEFARYYLDTANELGYVQNGLTFFPERSPYRSASPTEKRILTEVADVCSWVPSKEIPQALMRGDGFELMHHYHSKIIASNFKKLKSAKNILAIGDFLPEESKNTIFLNTSSNSKEDKEKYSFPEVKKLDIIFIYSTEFLSYYFENETRLQELNQFIHGHLEKEGHVILFYMDGDSITQLFEPSFNGLNLKNLKLGPLFIDYFPTFIHIQSTQKKEQKINKIFVTDLLKLNLEVEGKDEENAMRADKEQLLNPHELILSRLYTLIYLKQKN